MKCPNCDKTLTVVDSVLEVITPFGKIEGKVYECCESNILEQNLVKGEIK